MQTDLATTALTSTTTSPLGDQSAKPAARLDWVDVAKAGAIVLVVVYHVGNVGASFLLPGSISSWNAPWRALNTWLLPVRMPLFFLVSGVLAAGAVRRPWRAVWRPRIADLLWPFLLWSVVFGVAYGAGYEIGPDGMVGPMVTNWTAIPLGGTAYWYLSSLVLFFCVARIGRRIGPALVVMGFFAWLTASSLAPILTPELGVTLTTNVVRWCTFAIWFLLGCFAREAVLSVSRVPALPMLAVSAPLYVVLALKVYDGGGGDNARWVLGLNVIGTLTAVMLSVTLARSAMVRRVCTYLAKRTLPIYLIHPVALNIVVAIIRQPDGTTAILPASPLVGALFTPVVSILLVLLSTTAYDGLRRIGGDWLFQLPRRRQPAKDHETRR